MTEERVQKLIARAGVCSRRQADRMVIDGRVTINGRVAVPGDVADSARDHIKVDGKLLPPLERLRHLLMYKPDGVVTTCDDPQGRPTVIDLLGSEVKERVYPVGRLDFHSEGLLMLTNDGDLAARVTHPRYGVAREYHAKIRGDLGEREIRKLLNGTRIDGRHVKPLSLARLGSSRKGVNSWWRITVREGRTHEVREMFFRAGHHVQTLRRVAIGPLRDDKLKPGDYRSLSKTELKNLRRVARVSRNSGRHRRKRRGGNGTC